MYSVNIATAERDGVLLRETGGVCAGLLPSLGIPALRDLNAIGPAVTAVDPLNAIIVFSSRQVKQFNY